MCVAYLGKFLGSQPLDDRGAYGLNWWLYCIECNHVTRYIHILNSMTLKWVPARNRRRRHGTTTTGAAAHASLRINTCRTLNADNTIIILQFSICIFFPAKISENDHSDGWILGCCYTYTAHGHNSEC